MRLFCLFACLISTSLLADDGRVRVLEGRVTDASGKPIKGAAVEWGFFTSERPEREVFRTNEEGKYRVETTRVGPDYRLGVSAVGFAPQWIDGLIPKFTGEESGVVDFKLTRPITLRGRVVDKQGKPIQGARVIAQSPSMGIYSSFSLPTPSYPFPGPSREGTTDAGGQFSIKYLPKTDVPSDAPDRGHSFELSIKTPTGRMPRGKGYSGIDNTLVIDRDYLVESEKRTGVIRGKVLDAESGDPVERFKIVIRHRPEMIDCSDPAGHFDLKNLNVGRRYQIFIYAEDYAPAEVRITARETRERPAHECRLERAPSLRGRVVDAAGKPIRGAEVVVGVQDSKHNANRFYWGAFKKLVDGYMGLKTVQRATTGDDGHFVFSQGEQQGILAVMAPGYARRFVPVAERGELMRGDRLQIVLGPEAGVTGEVRLGGEPEPGASLRLSRVGMWELDFGELGADENGRFKIGELAPDNYVLSVYQQSGNMSSVRLSMEITLNPGRMLDVVLDDPGGDCSLTGSASPFSLITLTPKALNQEGTTYCRQIGTTATAEGHYRLSGLHPGKYEIFARNPSVRTGFHHQSNKSEIDVRGATVHDLGSVREITGVSPR